MEITLKSLWGHSSHFGVTLELLCCHFGIISESLRGHSRVTLEMLWKHLEVFWVAPDDL